MIGRIKAGGGSKINGLVQEYTAGENIESGDFVELKKSKTFSRLREYSW